MIDSMLPQPAVSAANAMASIGRTENVLRFIEAGSLGDKAQIGVCSAFAKVD
jgi:hypothetical protein